MRRRLQVELVELIPLPADFRLARTRVADHDFLGGRSEHPVQPQQPGLPRVDVIDDRHVEVELAD